MSLSGLFAGTLPVAAATCNSASKQIGFGTTQTITLDASNNFSAFVCPTGTPSGTALLDFKATPSVSQDFSLCLNGSNTAHDSSVYVRSSHLKDSPAQRVGVLTPFKNAEYQVAIDACDSLTLSLLGPSSGSFNVNLSYLSSPNGSPSHGFAFATQHLPVATTPSIPGSGEPSIAVDRLHGNRVYVSAPVGIPSGGGCVVEPPQTPPSQSCNGIDFWFSTNAGSAFAFCNPSRPNGGGDSHVVLDTTGSIYGADLAATNVDTQKLASGPTGPGTPNPAVDSCGFQDTQPTAAASDREWLATYLPDPSKGTNAAQVVLSYHDLAAEMVWECVGASGSGGQLYEPSCYPMITNPDAAIDSSFNTINGNQVFDSKGNIYSLFGVSTVGSTVEGGSFIHNLYVAKSTDGGHTFTDYPVILSQAPHSADTASSQSVANIFATIAADRADNLYAVWSQMKDSGGPATIRLSSSTDRGVSWSAPVVVNSGSLKSNVLPWVVAGDDGRIDVVWVGSSNASQPADVNGDWNIYMAQSVNAHSAHPQFAQTLVSPQRVRMGWACTQGVVCAQAGDDGRILLDFISVDVDSAGMANISYGDFGPDTSHFNASGDGFNPYTDYAKQVAGSSLNAPAAKPHGQVQAAVGLPFTGASRAGIPVVPVALLCFGLLALAAAAIARRGFRRGSSQRS